MFSNTYNLCSFCQSSPLNSCTNTCRLHGHTQHHQGMRISLDNFLQSSQVRILEENEDDLISSCYFSSLLAFCRCPLFYILNHLIAFLYPLFNPVYCVYTFYFPFFPSILPLLPTIPFFDDWKLHRKIAISQSIIFGLFLFSFTLNKAQFPELFLSHLMLRMLSMFLESPNIVVGPF